MILDVKIRNPVHVREHLAGSEASSNPETSHAVPPATFAPLIFLEQPRAITRGRKE
jgi:hypothetical protein